MDTFTALYLLLLAIVVAYLISSKVPAIFQTTVLSASSFMNGVILIVAMITLSNAETTAQTILGFIAVALASANAVGSYIITSRLQDFFKKNNEVGDDK